MSAEQSSPTPKAFIKVMDNHLLIRLETSMLGIFQKLNHYYYSDGCLKIYDHRLPADLVVILSKAGFIFRWEGRS